MRNKKNAFFLKMFAICSLSFFILYAPGPGILEFPPFMPETVAAACWTSWCHRLAPHSLIWPNSCGKSICEPHR